MEKQKRKIRPLFVIAGVFLILMSILVAFYIIGSRSMASQGICQSSECFISSANSCGNSTFYSTEDIGLVMYETKDCFFVKTVVKTNDNELPEVKALVEGKSLICNYNYGEFDNRWINSLSDGIENCQGDLKEAIGSLIVFSAS